MQARHLPLALLAAFCLGGAAGAQTAAPEAATKVLVAAARIENITGDTIFIGRVEAVDSVALIARVPGYLRGIDVANGAEVKADQILFRIEPEQYQATVSAREAELARAQANQALSQIELDRKRQLVQRGTSPQSELDVAVANDKAAQAAIAAAQAALDQAKLDLSYTQISAPFDGQIGRIAKSIGDLVGPDAGALATLVSEHPIYVAFSLNERQLANLMEARRDGEGSADSVEGDPTIRVDLPNGKPLNEVGKLAYAENRIDTATGTLAVRAEFPNADEMLVPGAFVTLHVQTAEPQPQLVIPQAAVQRDQKGAFVLVVGQQQTVEQRYITTGNAVGIDIVVNDGLNPGESVIVEGLQRVRPGVPVEAVTAPAAPKG